MDMDPPTDPLPVISDFILLCKAPNVIHIIIAVYLPSTKQECLETKGKHLQYTSILNCMNLKSCLKKEAVHLRSSPRSMTSYTVITDADLVKLSCKKVHIFTKNSSEKQKVKTEKLSLKQLNQLALLVKKM